MKVHDYTQPRWGHALHSPRMVEANAPLKWWERLLRREPVRYNYLTALGHGYGVAPGDALLVQMASGKVARFIVREIKWFSDPRDMFDVIRADFDSCVEPSA